MPGADSILAAKSTKRGPVNESRPEFKTGVNYWPSRSAMRMWKEFDPGEVREDFARMSEYKLSPARVFLLWEDFQPEPLRVSTRALDRLVRVCSDAADFGTSIWVTLFAGHVSGANWLPDWVLSPDGDETFFRIITGGAVVETFATGVVNPYENADLRKSQKMQIREVLAALQGHPAVWGWDLGNEPANVFRPAGPEQGSSWLREMAGEIRSKDDSRPVTFGLGRRDLEEDRGICPADVARSCDAIALDACPPYPDWVPAGSYSLFPTFLAEVTGWLAGWKPVWISRFGASTGGERRSEAEEQAARKASEILNAMRIHGVPGALWRSFADYAPRLQGICAVRHEPRGNFLRGFYRRRSSQTSRGGPGRGGTESGQRSGLSSGQARLDRYGTRGVPAGPGMAFAPPLWQVPGKPVRLTPGTEVEISNL